MREARLSVTGPVGVRLQLEVDLMARRKKSASKNDAQVIRDRVKEFRRVKASELGSNPKNWRKHTGKQRGVMKTLLSEIGFAGAVLARESDTGLVLIDGHLRQEMVDIDFEIPLLILDVTEKEADGILATYDPVSAMAGADSSSLEELLSGLGEVGNDMSAVFSQVAEEYGAYFSSEDDEGVFSDLDQQLNSLEGIEDVAIRVIVPKKYAEETKEWLANGEPKTAVGIGRGVLKRCGLL